MGAEVVQLEQGEDHRPFSALLTVATDTPQRCAMSFMDTMYIPPRFAFNLIVFDFYSILFSWKMQHNICKKSKFVHSHDFRNENLCSFAVKANVTLLSPFHIEKNYKKEEKCLDFYKKVRYIL